MFESGQDGNVAAIRTNVCVYPFLYLKGVAFMKCTTLCYLIQDNKLLMLQRIKKKEDVNKGKWIGVGGKFEKNESPDECAVREIYEETGLSVHELKPRGIVTFCYNNDDPEYMHLFTSESFSGELNENCNEGVLKWVEKEKVYDLNLWEGDRIFLDLLLKDEPYFLLKLMYHNDELLEAVLNGKKVL